MNYHTKIRLICFEAPLCATVAATALLFTVSWWAATILVDLILAIQIGQIALFVSLLMGR